MSEQRTEHQKCRYPNIVADLRDRARDGLQHEPLDTMLMFAAADEIEYLRNEGKLKTQSPADRVAEHNNKSCPFCGLRNWRIAQRKDTYAMQVECASCGARGPLCVPDKAAAVAAWNDREKVA